MARFVAMLSVCLLALACKPMAESGLGVSSLSAAAPPAEVTKTSRVSSKKSTSANHSANSNVICENGVCTLKSAANDLSGLEAPFQKPVATKKYQKRSPSQEPLAESIEPPPGRNGVNARAGLGNTTGSKWYTGDRSAYYRGIEGTPHIMRLFQADGDTATDWLYNKKTKQLVRFKDGSLGEGGQMNFGEGDEIYQMSSDGSKRWKGVGQVYQDGSLEKTGMNYYYGKKRSHEGIQEGWGHVYEVDPRVYAQRNPDAPIASYLQENSISEPVLFDRAPSSYQSGSIEHFSSNILASLFGQPTRPAVAASHGSIAAGRAAGSAGQVASASAGGRTVAVFGIGCGACTPARKRLAASLGHQVVTIPMAANQYGVRSFPSLVQQQADGSYQVVGTNF